VTPKGIWHQIDEKMTFLNGDLQEKFAWHNPQVLSCKEKNVRDATRRNPIMN
jgi:hypothetical protein